MMKVLVTGANGFIGQAMCSVLADSGYSVRAAVRSLENLDLISGEEWDGPRVRWTEVGEIGPETDWGAALFGVEVVVHLAARVHVMPKVSAETMEECRNVNVRGTERLALMASKSRTRRLVYLSSVKVNGERTGTHPFTETDPPRPDDPYSMSKWEAERVLREIEQQKEIEVVIIRPPLIYGPGVKANFLKLIQLIERGVPLPFGSIQNQRSLLSLSNLVDLMCCCLDHPAAGGETFMASDGEDVSTPELVRRIAQALGKPARLLSMPEWMIKLGGVVTGKSNQVKRLCSSLQIDSSKVRQMLGWSPPFTMKQELGRVAVWRKGHSGIRDQETAENRK